MDDNALSREDIARLRRREEEILQRLERLKKTMNETKAIDTLAFKSKLFKEAQDELRRIQEKLAGIPPE